MMSTAIQMGLIGGAFGGLLRFVSTHRTRPTTWTTVKDWSWELASDCLLGMGAGLVSVVAVEDLSPIVLTIIGGFAGVDILTRKVGDVFGELVYSKTNKTEQRLDMIAKGAIPDDQHLTSFD